MDVRPAGRHMAYVHARTSRRASAETRRHVEKAGVARSSRVEYFLFLPSCSSHACTEASYTPVRLSELDRGGFCIALLADAAAHEIDQLDPRGQPLHGPGSQLDQRHGWPADSDRVLV